MTTSTPRGKGSFHGRQAVINSSGGNGATSNANCSTSSALSGDLVTASVAQQVPMRRTAPPTLPPPPPGLTELQKKRRLIVQSIVHSENSYVATLQRLVNVGFLH